MLAIDSKLCVRVYVETLVAAELLVVRCSISLHFLLIFLLCSSCHVLFLQVNVRLVFILAVFKSATLIHVLFPFLRMWVKNYLHCRYMFCSWLYCWLRMTRYTGSTPLLQLWCRCDLDSPFLSWVLCHKHGHSEFHLHQRRAEGSDPFLWAEGVPGVKMHRMMSVQYGNSVMSQRIVC